MSLPPSNRALVWSASTMRVGVVKVAPANLIVSRRC
jgi:hypothetical protein